MKKIGFVLAYMFVQVASAQLDPSLWKTMAPGEEYAKTSKLSMDDTFVAKTSTVQIARGPKSCKASHGKYMGHGRCRIDHVTAKLTLQKSEISDAVNIKIESLNASKQIATFEGVGANINRVQLMAPVSDQCNLLVMFTSPTTMATEVSGLCSDDEKSALTIDGLVKK